MIQDINQIKNNLRLQGNPYDDKFIGSDPTSVRARTGFGD